MPFEELKARHAAVWSAGPYQGSRRRSRTSTPRSIDRLAPEPGQRFLDLACGTGAVAELRGAAGAEVVGIDLAPALIERRRGEPRSEA